VPRAPARSARQLPGGRSGGPGSAGKGGGAARPPGIRTSEARRPNAEAGAPDAALTREVGQAARPGTAHAAEGAFVRAATALTQDDTETALVEASTAKRLAPRSSAVRELLGIAMYRSSRFQEALSELSAYRRMTGRPDQNHLIADAHRALGSPEKGVPLVREAIAAHLPPEIHAEAVVVGASALADLGRFDEALALLQTFPVHPDVGAAHDLRVWYVRGDVLERAGRLAEAARMFTLIVRHQPEAFDAAERLSFLQRSP
jgi:tetratricopeptide (TPR) repeat protein